MQKKNQNHATHLARFFLLKSTMQKRTKKQFPENIMVKCNPGIGNPVDHLQGSLGPPGPKTLKKSEKKSPRASGHAVPRKTEKISKKKGLSRPFQDFFQTRSRDFFETFSGLSRVSRAPGDLFFRFLQGFWARRAQKTSENGQLGSLSGEIA